MRASSESDDTASTISTVVDNLSQLSAAAGNVTDHHPAAAAAANVPSTTADLAKVLNSFAMLEREFQVVSISSNAPQLEECLTNVQPPASFQDFASWPEAATNAVAQTQYENVTVTTSSTATAADNVNSSAAYENVVVTISTAPPKTPPKPLPRTTPNANASNVDRKSQPPSLIPKPRTKSQADEAAAVAVHAERNEMELPRLIHFVPKIVSTTPVISMDTITINNSVPTPIKKCIRLPDNGDGAVSGGSSSCNSSTATSDEDEEKSYAMGGGGPNRVSSAAATDFSSTPSVTSSSDGDDDDEEDKLGPPSIVDGPGPSEAYFNFPWSTNMLPTIGEVEEEFSSLEPASETKWYVWCI